MLENIRSSLKYWGVALIGPAINSILFNLVYPTSTDAAYIVTIIGSLVTMRILVEIRDDAFATFHFGWMIISVITFIIIHANHYQSHIGLTTIATALLVWGMLSVDKLNQIRLEVREKVKRAVTETEEAKREAFVQNITKLIGDDSQTRALLVAVERLSKYVPEVGNHLLEAVEHDAERFIMLRALEGSTDNEVLRQTSKDEADDIARSARALCSDSTKMALELLHEYQEVEADSTLGEERGSELARAHEDFKKYLAGLREVSDHLGPKPERKLGQEIRDLEPAKEIRSISEVRESTKKLRSGKK